MSETKPQIDQFTAQEFEAALTEILNGVAWTSLGFLDGELTYAVPIKNTNKRLVVRSSIDRTGQAAAKGKDSIRVWVEYWHKSARTWRILGKDSKAWTTRVRGWQERLKDRLRQCWKLALADKPKIAEGAEICPFCGEGMILRTNRITEDQFWGCSNYPKCKGSKSIGADQTSPGLAEKLVDALVKSQIKDFKWAGDQTDVFTFVGKGKGHGVVEAVAGSGKTTTIVEALNYTDPAKAVGFVAFNKHIATELKQRAPSHVHVSTNHSLGLANIRAVQDKIKVDEDKLYRLLRDIEETLEPDEYYAVRANRPNLRKLVSLAKANMLAPCTETFEFISDRWNIEVNGDADLMYRVAGLLFEQSVADMAWLDYDDMIWFSAAGKVACKQFDILFIDEAQDLNKAQAALVTNSIAPGGRIIAVGDRHQCQPAGTMIAACAYGNRWYSETEPDLVPIENVKIGDKIMTYDRRSATLIKKGSVTAVTKRWFDGWLFTVSAAGKSTRCTPGHKWLVRWNKEAENAHVVYLMRKDNKFRVGQTKMFRNESNRKDFGLGLRARQERADCAWILKVFDNVVDATMYENLISAKHGLPQMIFHEAANLVHVTQEKLDSFYELVGNRFGAAAQCLGNHGRDIKYPLYINHKSGTRQRQGRSTIFETQACNLISGYMKIPVLPRGAINPANRVPAWEKVTVDVEKNHDYVYSLNIEKHHKYVADGLITCNSIYGFAGADADSIPNLIDLLEATVLPLSTTYRCPKSHVLLAQRLVPQIEAAEWAAEGIVKDVNEYEFVNRVTAGDLVLCRCNAPLVAPAFLLIRRGIKAVILGRDIGRGLKRLLSKVQKKHNVHNLFDTLAALVEYGDKEIGKLLKMKKQSRAQALEDRIETIIALADGSSSMGQLEEKIETIFSDAAEGVTFSSVHRAKGAEADRVWILRPDLMPHPRVSAAWEMQQEHNIQYVALTRAKKELCFVQE